MPARRGLSHFVVLMLAALQFTVPGLAALADGLAARTSAHATAHIESGTERDCVRVHETDCVFCQFLSTSAAPASAETVAALAEVVRDAPRLADSAPHVRAFPRPGDPRGPPGVGSI